MGIGRDPADVVRPRAWWKAPSAPRRDLLQRVELGPVTAVPGDENAARFCPGVQRAVGRADRHREHVVLLKGYALPGPTAVRAQSGAGAARADQDPLAVRGNAGSRDPVQHRAGGPPAVSAESHHSALT